MAHNNHTNKEEKGMEMPFSGGGKLAVTLDQLVDYATGLDDKKDAEMMELMCYRLFARNMTPQAADKIAEIPQKFKKTAMPTIGITFNHNGDKVEKKTVIPSVANYNENVEQQENKFPMPTLDTQEQKRIAE